MVSQAPVVLATVSMIVPTVLKMCPSKLYGNALAHISRLTVVVNNGCSVTLIVLMVSQPLVVLATVSVIVPTVLKMCPSKVYGNALAHTSMLTVVVNNGSFVTLIVLMVSQPPIVDTTLSTMVEGASNTCPSNVYGNALAHTSMLTVVVNNGCSVTLIVLMVSQAPVVLATVSMIVEGVSNTCPSKLYGNPLVHTSMLTVVVKRGSSVTLIVLMVSQPPVVLATVSLIDPTILKI